MQQRRHVFGVCALLTALSNSSAAFESFEHKAIGDMAMTLASMSKSCESDADECTALVAPADGPTYGDLVQCVDRYLTPEKMIAVLREDVRSEHPTKLPALSAAFPGPKALHGSKRACKYPISSFDTSSAQAGHNNHAHFQDELLLSIATYHALALTVARDQKNPGGALVINAIANHYLQDMFAPGHLASRRSTLTDTASLAMHDFHNRRGARFMLAGNTQSATDDYSGTYKALRTMKCLLLDDADHDDDCKNATRFANATLDKKTYKHRADEVLCQLLYQPGGKDKRGCAEPAEKTDRARLDKVLAAVGALLHQERTWICMKGDNFLWRPAAQECRDYLLQRVFLVAVSLESILDVLEAGRGGEYVNNFGKIAWDYEAPFRDDDFAYAAMPFGEYYLGKHDDLPRESAAEAKDRSTDAYSLPIRRETSNDLAFARENDPGKSNFHPDKLFRVSVGRESFYKGERVVRNVYSIEKQRFWGEINRREPWNIGTGVGLVGVRELDAQAGGGIVRIITTLPKFESTFSGWARRMHHSGNTERGWRNGYGLNYEQGFTSMFSVFIGMGRDYGAISGGALRQGTVFFAGIAFTLSGARIQEYLPSAQAAGDGQ